METSNHSQLDMVASERHSEQLRSAMQAYFTLHRNQPLVLASVDAPRIWLDAIADGPVRQYHNCSSCLSFLKRYGGLATVKDDGSLESALFPPGWEGELGPSVAAVRAAISKANVARAPKLLGRIEGRPSNEDSKRGTVWRHLHTTTPIGMRAIEARERFVMLTRGLADYSLPTLEQAYALLTGGNLLHAERHAELCAWLIDCAKTQNRNLRWRQAISSPVGWCNFRGGALGALLDDVAANRPFAEIKRKWDTVRDPLKYQRPQSVSVNQLAVAEKRIAELGYASSLRRRPATMEDVPESIWRPAPPVASRATGKVFGHVKASDSAAAQQTIEQPAVPIAWERFLREILPGVQSIRVVAPPRGNYRALVTAADAIAPNILQWDNPVSGYVYAGGSSHTQWNIPSGPVEVSALIADPSTWGGNKPHGAARVLVAIKNCRDMHNRNSALFPEMLRSELHPLRAAIAAYSRQTPLEPCEGDAVAGLDLANGSPVTLLLPDGRSFLIDRMA